MLVRFCMRRGEFMLEVCVRDITKAVEAEEEEDGQKKKKKMMMMMMKKKMMMIMKMSGCYLDSQVKSFCGNPSQ